MGVISSRLKNLEVDVGAAALNPWLPTCKVRRIARFLSIRAGSASESEHQLLLARDLGYLQPDVHRQLDDQPGGACELGRYVPVARWNR